MDIAVAEHNFHPRYRPDIDGLRAFAIIPVVAYHAFPHYAPGGFIGVDIFFVISGYLISLIIFKSLARGDFVFSEFYAHRVKRLFPALLLVTATCYLFGWFALLPDEFEQLGKHIAAGLGFVQNIVLWKEAGYFDTASELKPLMHLWSLAVEEQFYLVYPLLLWLVWKFRANFLVVIAVLCVASFALSQKGIHDDPVKTFFAPYARFWEVMFGSVLAYLQSFREQSSSPAESWTTLRSNVFSVVGLLLIVYAIATYDSGMPYPGAAALLPAAGATLLIFAGPEAWINRRVLAARAVVWVGLISYPLYLWHWPLLSFARIVESENPPVGARLAAVIVSFLFAALTYYLVEKPIRYGFPSRRRVAMLCALAATIGGVGYGTFLLDGLPFRMREAAEKNSMFAEENHPGRARNQDQRCRAKFETGPNVTHCRLQKDGAPTIQLLGDSHANSVYPGLSDVLQNGTDNVMQLGASGCLPFPGVLSFDAKFETETRDICPAVTGQALAIATHSESIHTVIIWTRGPFYLSGKGFYSGDFSEERVHDRVLRSIAAPELTDHYAIWDKSLRETLDLLLSANKKVIYVLDNPELGFDPKSCLDSRPLRLAHRVKEPCAIPRKDFDERNKKYRELAMSVLKDYPSVKVFDAAEKLCDRDWCWAMKDGKMLYRDDDHLSLDGSRMIAKELVKLLH